MRKEITARRLETASGMRLKGPTKAASRLIALPRNRSARSTLISSTFGGWLLLALPLGSCQILNWTWRFHDPEQTAHTVAQETLSSIRNGADVATGP